MKGCFEKCASQNVAKEKRGRPEKRGQPRLVAALNTQLFPVLAPPVLPHPTTYPYQTAGICYL